MTRRKKFNVGDMVRYNVMQYSVEHVPNGTIGIILELPKKPHEPYQVYFQVMSIWRDHLVLVREDHIVPEKDWDKYWPTELASQLDTSGSIISENI